MPALPLAFKKHQGFSIQKVLQGGSISCPQTEASRITKDRNYMTHRMDFITGFHCEIYQPNPELLITFFLGPGDPG